MLHPLFMKLMLCQRKMELMTKSREKWIDNAKGLAILLVIIGHVSGGLSGISFQFVYGIHLVMFFLISGYTLICNDRCQEAISPDSGFCGIYPLKASRKSHGIRSPALASLIYVDSENGMHTPYQQANGPP